MDLLLPLFPDHTGAESKGGGLVWALLFVLLVAFIVKSTSHQKKKKKHQKQKAPEAKGRLPLIGHLHLLGGGVPVFRTLSSMAEAHGPIFSLRLGFHNTLIVSGRELARECLSTFDKIFATRPNIAAGRYMGYNNAFFALAPYGEYWREMRKIATLELLSPQRLQKLKHVRDSEILCLVKDLFSTYERHHKNITHHDHMVEVPMSQLLEHLTFNINVRIIAGKRFSGDEKTLSDEEGEAFRLKKAVKEMTYLSGVFVEADALPLRWHKWVDLQGHVRAMKKTAKDIDSVLQLWLHQHLHKTTAYSDRDDSDFMDVLISMFSDQDALICGHQRDVVIKATALTLILTGTGSTAITVTWALSLLLNHPNVLKKAQDELDTNIGTHKWVQESDITNLQYLQAIIKETLRLYPPAPLTGIREAMEDCFVGGYFVQKGTRLLINIWKLQRDPQAWKNPNEFLPERFMEDDHKDLDFKGQNFEYIPFSSGRRSCPGTTFGLQVVSLTLARLLQGFDLSAQAQAPAAKAGGVAVEMSEGLGVALPKLNPLQVMIKPRLSFELYQQL
ncbi:cytochrome P450 82G1 [Neltuma alba]|uniref:cytochrome P450 82G1 n=1 Tax=Neltuma alba TaxID=207710 RepID=UPI0010A376A7|nr:cytochrome P450 82G1-like [Prosopis alba]